MASHYVHEDNRKLKYVTRAVTYPIQRITEPSDNEDRKYRSIEKMCAELHLSQYKVRAFVKDKKDSSYIRSSDGVLYLLKKPIKDVAITGRLADEDISSGAPLQQEFTSLYQLVKRFRVSYSTVAELKAMQPLGVECKKTIYDEFKRKYHLTFYK